MVGYGINLVEQFGNSEAFIFIITTIYAFLHLVRLCNMDDKNKFIGKYDDYFIVLIAISIIYINLVPDILIKYILGYVLIILYIYFIYYEIVNIGHLNKKIKFYF